MQPDKDGNAVAPAAVLTPSVVALGRRRAADAVAALSSTHRLDAAYVSLERRNARHGSVPNTGGPERPGSP